MFIGTPAIIFLQNPRIEERAEFPTGREGGLGEGGGYSICACGRSRMTIDPCIPTMPGRSTSGFRQPGSRRGGGGDNGNRRNRVGGGYR